MMDLTECRVLDAYQRKGRWCFVLQPIEMLVPTYTGRHYLGHVSPLSDWQASLLKRAHEEARTIKARWTASDYFDDDLVEVTT